MKNLMAFALATTTAFASTNDFLTWEQCLARSWAHNPVLAGGRSAIRELEYRVGTTSANFYPQISVSAGFTKRGLEDDRGWTERDSSSAGVSLNQDLFAGFGNIANRRRALLQLRIGYEEYRQFHADIEFSVRASFINILYAQDLIELTKRIEERRRNNVRLIQMRFDGGRENAGSLARSKAQLSEAIFEVREAERLLMFSRRDLAAAMGTTDLPVGASGILEASAPDDLIDLKRLMEQTTDYIIAQIQVEASKQGVIVTRSSRFPSLDLNASAGLSGERDLDFGDWSVGLRASMPLFTGNRLRNEVAAAKEEVIQSEMGLMSKSHNLMATLQKRWNSYLDAVEDERVQKELLDAELLRAEISIAKYRQGLLSYEDWDQIEGNLIDQGKKHLQRRLSSEIEQALWKNALGWSEWDMKKGD